MSIKSLQDDDLLSHFNTVQRNGWRDGQTEFLYQYRPSSPSPLLAVPNVTAHPSTASVGYQLRMSMWRYNCLWRLKC